MRTCKENHEHIERTQSLLYVYRDKNKPKRHCLLNHHYEIQLLAFQMYIKEVFRLFLRHSGTTVL